MRPIDGDAMRQDLRRQFEAIYKSAIETPIMPDDPFVKLLAKCEGLHMKAYIDNPCEYIDSRPTIDVPPVRRGEWVNRDYITTAYGHIDCADCTNCGALEVPLDKYGNFCPNCGADMRGE